MHVATINYLQLQLLLRSRKSFVVLFLARWEQRIGKTFQQSVQTVLKSQLPIEVLFVLWIDGSDDPEEYIVQHLNASKLPLIAFYQHGILKQHSTALETGCWNIKALIEESVGMISMGADIDRDAISDILKDSNGTFLGQIFISGDRSSVGKSSICLALLTALVCRLGIPAADIAYIKPVTQCEAEQPVTRFCHKAGISHCSIGPVVFYSGFTRAFLAGETDSSEQLLALAVAAVEKIAHGKRIVIVDGVGYPSVGSICNISNAHVAQALKAPVLLVGKSGVGDAVDSYNLNATFFESKQVRVLGGIFNKLPLDGFYNLESCKQAVSSFFSQYRPLQMPYGFLPQLQLDAADGSGTVNTAGTTTITAAAATSVTSEKQTMVVQGEGNDQALPVAFDESVLSTQESALLDAFMEHVNVHRLLHDMWWHQMTLNTSMVDTSTSASSYMDSFPRLKGMSSSSFEVSSNSSRSSYGSSGGSRHMSVEGSQYSGKNSLERSEVDRKVERGSRKRSREEVLAAAVQLGARGS